MLGGPLRRYVGKAMSGSTLLEVNVRPPVEANVDAAVLRYGHDDAAAGGGGDAIDLEEMDWDCTRNVFARVLRKRVDVEMEEEMEGKVRGGRM